MSVGRVQDMQLPAGPTPARRRDDGVQEPTTERQSSDATQFEEAIRQHRRDDARLLALLRNQPHERRFAARLALARHLGGERSNQLWTIAFGAEGGAVGPPPASSAPTRPPVNVGDRRASYELARAEHLARRLEAALDGASTGAVDHSLLIAAVEPHVGLAALAMARARSASRPSSATRPAWPRLTLLRENATWGQQLAHPLDTGVAAVSDRVSNRKALAHQVALADRSFDASRAADQRSAWREEIEEAAATSSGAELPRDVSLRMKTLLDHDFGHVRIHTDNAAALLAASLGARAVTIGHHVYFARGHYLPGTPSGDRLLVHELTHVIQYDAGRLPSAGEQLDVARHDDPSEREARAAEAKTERSAEPAPSQERPRTAGRTAAMSPATSHERGTAQMVLLDAATPGGAAPLPEGAIPMKQIGIVQRDEAPLLRLRSSPSTNAAVIGELPFNTRVQISARLPGDWYQVATLDGKIGYAAASYIWTAPTHALPEPGARLHKVQSGKPGFAISIAAHYFGTGTNQDNPDSVSWGEDLRFYVNVLAAVNHKQVPDGVDGWRSVQFDANDYIWIPSLGFAQSMRGKVNSGSLSYEVASALGVADLIKRVGQLYDDFGTAIELSKKYIPKAVARHVEEAVLSVLVSLLELAAGAMLLLAITTAVGALLGGGAPGAALGFEVGMLLIEWIGLAFLAKWIVDSVSKIGSAFGTFLKSVWNARGDRKVLDRAAQELAEAIGTLAGVFVEALVMWAMAKGVGKALEFLKGTKLGEAFGESKLGKWLEDRVNHKALEEREAKKQQEQLDRKRLEEEKRKREAEDKKRQEEEKKKQEEAAKKARAERLEELSRDHLDHNGEVSPGTRAEAEVALSLEEKGQLDPPIRRPLKGEGHSGDFVDGKGKDWDVKSERSRSKLIEEIKAKARAAGKPEPKLPGDRPIKGEFDLAHMKKVIEGEFKSGEGVIIDTRGLDAADLTALKSVVNDLGWSDRVKFGP